MKNIWTPCLMMWKEYYVIGKLHCTKMKFFIKIFLSKYGQIRDEILDVKRYF